ncbi:MAG: helix-turn-helix domain-containing protein [Sciscionella sp.]
MASPEPRSVRARLAMRLRELREATGTSGNAFAAHIGWQQSRVSKLETGVQLPTPDDLTTWFKATNARDDARRELVEMLKHARVEYSSWRHTYASHVGAAAAQDSIAERERDVAHTREFAPTMIPGLLQTAEYAREVLNSPSGPTAHGAAAEDIESMVAARIRRQDILYQQHRSAGFVLGEGALRYRFGAPETMTGQLDRLAVLAGLATVDLAVIPFATPLPAYPLGMFKLYGDTLAMVESLQGEQLAFDAQQIADFERCYELLRKSAIEGAEAIGFVRRVAAELR